MIIYTKSHHTITKEVMSLDQNIPENTVWIDLPNISSEEEIKLERYFNLDLPVYKEVQSSSISNRLYEKYDAIFITITLHVSNEDNIDDLRAYNITFVVIKNILITIRELESGLFNDILSNIEMKHIAGENECFSLLAMMLENILNYISSFLETIDHHLEEKNNNVVAPALADKKISYKVLLKDISNIGNSVSKARETLLTIHRAITFLLQTELVEKHRIFASHIKMFLKDIDALRDHATFLAGKVNFLLDATLGLINIEQNNIIKIFSVVTVIFTPPTLIASIYGMNFEVMPELKWAAGYPMALILMLISAWIPYRYFKKKNWY
ncbi:Magnesium transport protein CorA [Rickettsiales bacterium Ac37b]|nr:Magnesium transport protein CorA [Rickettsiales bacterium Ac37b]